MKDNFLTCIIYIHSEEEENLLTCLLSNFKSINLTICLHNPAETLESLNTYHPDLLFIDIEDSALLNYVHRPPFIIGMCEKKHTRNLKKYLRMGFYDFLVKPLQTEDFQNIIGKILNTYIPKNKLKTFYPMVAEDAPLYNNKILEKAQFSKESIFLKGNRKRESLRILFDDVEYLNVMNHEVVIHFENGTTKTMRTSLKYFQEKLPSSKFQKINKNTIINLDKIEKIIKNNKLLIHGKSFDVTRSFKKTLMLQLDI